MEISSIFIAKSFYSLGLGEGPPFQINVGFGEPSLRLFNLISLKIVGILILYQLLVLLQAPDMGS